MSDPTPRDPTRPERERRDRHDERDVRDLLAAADAPEHASGFWDELEGRLAVVRALQTYLPPDHGDRFWAEFDARLQAEPDRDVPAAEVVPLGATVFRDAADAPVPARRRQRLTHRRLQRLVQLSAAAAIVAVLAGAVAWWGTREDEGGEVIAGPGNSSTTTTTIALPSTTRPPDRVEQPKPLTPGTVPIGASPDGKYLYVVGPSLTNERCTFGPSTSPQTTQAKWLYAEPVDGSPRRRILTDRVFADPHIAVGPSAKVVVSDACNGSTRHLIASPDPNGSLSVDEDVATKVTIPLAVDGAAWSKGGTGLIVKGAGTSGWYRYDLANDTSERIPDLAATAQMVEQLANDQFVSVTRRNATTWAVSVGTKEVAAINAPSHDDFLRAVRIDASHSRIAIAGKDTLLVLTTQKLDVDVTDYDYRAEAITWSADGAGLIAAASTGGLQYLTFAPAADQPLTVALQGYDGVAQSLITVPTSTTLVVREAAAGAEPGEALLLRLVE